MTPKEKAEELVTRFAPYSEDDVNVPYTDMMMAKCCALIAVDEILKIAKTGIMHFYPCDNDRCGCADYWQAVKNEIEKL